MAFTIKKETRKSRYSFKLNYKVVKILFSVSILSSVFGCIPEPLPGAPSVEYINRNNVIELVESAFNSDLSADMSITAK